MYHPAILIALILELWLGGFFAFCARARIRQAGPWAQPSLALVGTFVAILLAPATVYLYLAHPDWAWLYLVDPEHVPRLVVVPIVAMSAAALGARCRAPWRAWLRSFSSSGSWPAVACSTWARPAISEAAGPCRSST